MQIRKSVSGTIAVVINPKSFHSNENKIEKYVRSKRYIDVLKIELLVNRFFRIFKR